MRLASLAEQVRTGEQSAISIAEKALQDLTEISELNAVVWMDADMARIQARVVDRQVQEGRDPGLLAGVPVAIKDNIAFAGVPLECCSPALAGYTAPDNATVVQRLMDAGAIIVARTNMDEFAMGSSTERSVHGPSRNPHDPSRVCGGSSGGSAAVVAAGAVPLSLGSSTGGSVCQPASHCGVLGLEPTWGRLSRNGLVAFASSMDRVGLFTTSAEDAALVLSVLEGRDALDSTSLPVQERSPGGLRFGLVREAIEIAPTEITDIIKQKLDGCEIERVSIPLLEEALACYQVLSSAEAASNLARFDGIAYGGRRCFGPEVRRRILMGTWLLREGFREAWVERARGVRAMLQFELDRVLEHVDVLALPAAPTRAFTLGELLQDPVAMQAQDRFTALSGITGNPAISVPCATDGLPVGVLLIGRRGQESGLLEAAGRLSGTDAQ